MSKVTYQHLLELLGGDRDLIDRLIEIGEIEQRETGTAIVDVDRVLVVRTLVRELEVDWPGVEVILRLLRELADARRRIAELERSG
jgi:hypothetical protein